MINTPFSPQLGDVDTQRLQRGIARAFHGLSRESIIDGSIIKDIRIPVNSSTSTTVPHPLNRAINGYLVISRSNDSMVFNGSGSPKNPSKEFLVKASSSASPAPSDVEVSFWVF